MSDQVQDNAPDFLSMSDEELQKFDPSSLASGEAAEDQDDTEQNDDTDTGTGAADKGDAGEVAETAEDIAAAAAAAKALEEDDDNEGAGDEEVDDGKKEDKAGSAEAKPGVDKKDGQGKQAADPAAKADSDKNKPAADADADAAIDYKAAYERITGTFKANGRDIKVGSVDDAIALMQMGANYNKKMAALKPNLKLMKMLETNGLLDESNIGYLIDLAKKDPAAISKLVTDSKIDPLDLSADEAGKYKPGNHQVSDQEMELDAVLSELESSPAYNKTLEVVSNKWDEASRSAAVKEPQILKVINGHIESGIYDRITAEMDSERTFGRLKGLTDIEAYKQVGDAINARRGFDDLFQGSSQDKAKPTVAPRVIVAPDLKQAETDKQKDKKRAAGSTKAAPASGGPKDFDPLAMSDADFAKFKI